MEQEDYRTPRVSVTSVKNGKSFDLGGAARGGPCPSDSNGLIKVSRPARPQIISVGLQNKQICRPVHRGAAGWRRRAGFIKTS